MVKMPLRKPSSDIGVCGVSSQLCSRSQLHAAAELGGVQVICLNASVSVSHMGDKIEFLGLALAWPNF